MVIAAMVIYIAFNAGVMGWGTKHINALSGKKVQVLDLCFTGYSPEEVNGYLSEYSPSARSFAATFNVTADSLYPIVYTVVFSLVMAWVYKRRILANHRVGYLLLLPLFTMLVDFLENLHIIPMLRLYPEIPERIVIAGSILTTTKWAMVWLMLAIILAGLVLKVLKPKSSNLP